MNTEQQKQIDLMKHFSSVLRKLATDKQSTSTPDEKLLKYLSRKELVEILRDKHLGPLPKDLDLIESENTQLLKLIGNELHILAYYAKQWSSERSKEVIPEKKEDTQGSKPTKPAKKR